MKYINRIILLAAITLTSCMKLELEDLPIPPEPTTGNVTLVTDWTNRGEGIAIPSNYTVEVNNQTLTFEGISSPLPELEAGTYPVLIYNSAENITIDGTKATVKTENNTVDPSPGWLFTSAMDVVYEAGQNKVVTAMMQQQVRQLNFDFTITGGDAGLLQSVTASLTGVAGSMDYKENTYAGTGLAVVPVLNRYGNKLQGTIRLTGLTSEVKELTLGITYTTGKSQQIVSDISNELANFNQNKHIPLTLSADIEIARHADFEAIITGWEAHEGSSGMAW